MMVFICAMWLHQSALHNQPYNLLWQVRYYNERRVCTCKQVSWQVGVCWNWNRRLCTHLSTHILIDKGLWLKQLGTKCRIDGCLMPVKGGRRKCVSCCRFAKQESKSNVAIVFMYIFDTHKVLLYFSCAVSQPSSKEGPGDRDFQEM